MELADIPGAGESYDFFEAIIASFERGDISYAEAERQLAAACAGDVCLYFYERELWAARDLMQGDCHG